MSGCVVLVVDDEALVRVTIATRLRRMGCEVLEAGSGPEALTLLESRGDTAVVLSDCSMVPMSGPELAQIVLERWPHIPFVAMSGKLPAQDLPGAVRFFSKPIKAADLAALVETVTRSAA